MGDSRAFARDARCALPQASTAPDRRPVAVRRLDRGAPPVASCCAMARAVFVPGLVLWLSALSACGTDLGQCDMAAARRIVYRAGVPHYEGQALVESHCSEGLCHTANASGASRVGVPAGLNFDVPTAIDGSAGAIERLQGGLSNVLEWAETMWEQVEAGNMPPGRAGMRDPGVWVHPLSDGSVPRDCPNELAEVRSAQGKAILRNWLACGAPVVSGTEEACAQSPVLAAIGDCRPGDRSIPSGEDVYLQVVEGKGCTGCHNADSPNFSEHLLDLSRDDARVGLTDAYNAVVGADARGMQCAGKGKLIEPGNCEGSIFYEKLAAKELFQVRCGRPMPLGRESLAPPANEFDPELLRLLCAWIDAGAPMTPATTGTCGM